MKIRLQFVTNSSSSSFVVAVKGDTTYKMLFEALKNSDNVKEYIKFDYNMSDFGKEFVELSDEKKIQFVADDFSRDILNNMKHSLLIENWKVFGLEGGTEGEGGSLGSLLYLNGLPEVDFIRVKSFD